MQCYIAIYQERNIFTKQISLVLFHNVRATYAILLVEIRDSQIREVFGPRIQDDLKLMDDGGEIPKS